MMEPYPPNWFAFYFVLRLLLGQLAIRDWKWAALCGLVNALAMAYVLPRLPLTLGIHVAFVVISFPLLLGISRLPQLTVRVGAAVVGLLAFLTIFQIS